MVKSLEVINKEKILKILIIKSGYFLFRISITYLQKILKLLTFGMFSPPYTAALGIIIENNKILLIERSDGYGLGFPGGFMTIHEEVKTAIKREVYEETGLSVSVGSLAGILSGQRTKGGISTVDLIYECSIIGEKMTKDSFEGKCRWIDLKYLNPEEIAVDYYKIIKKYL